MYKIDKQKLIDYARERTPLPSDVKQKFLLVYVNDFIGEPEFVDRYFILELPNGDTLIIDKIETRIVYQVVFRKEIHEGMIIGWEYLGVREAGVILNQK